MKKTLLTGLLLTSAFLLFGQQEPQFSQNMFTHMAINPGYAGMNGAICASTLYRQQWVGFQQTDVNGDVTNGGPQTMLFTLDADVKRINSGFGLVIYKDQLGYEDNLGVKINYAYRFNALNGNLGIGASVGFLNKLIDFGKYNPLLPDPILGSKGIESDMTIDMSFGAYYKFPQDRGFVGISSSQLLEQTVDLPGQLASPQLARHYYLTAGYSFALPNPSLEFMPSFLVKSDLGSTQFDINALMMYNNRFWGGVSYRATDAVAVMAGMYPFATGSWQSLRIGYAYDITTSAIGAAGRSSGSHEIFLSYCFNIRVVPNPYSYSNTRYFY